VIAVSDYTSQLRALVDPRDWDDDRDCQIRWRMPESGSGFHVEVDDEGDVSQYRGTGWHVQTTWFYTADEAQWLANVWPSILLTINTIRGAA